VGTQLLAQSVVPEGQVPTQEPMSHFGVLGVALHEFPHLPQFSGSLWVSAQLLPLHISRLGRHAHWPPMQRPVCPHCVLQSPQTRLLSLAFWLLHSPGVLPFDGQSSEPAHEHIPLVQTSPSGQRLVQLPQKSGSVVVSTQTDRLVPATWHRVPVTQAQALFLHIMLLGHVLPQVPQLF
jgi:hypothetical protein